MSLVCFFLCQSKIFFRHLKKLQVGLYLPEILYVFRTCFRCDFILVHFKEHLINAFLLVCFGFWFYLFCLFRFMFVCGSLFVFGVCFTLRRGYFMEVLSFYVGCLIKF